MRRRDLVVGFVAGGLMPKLAAASGNEVVAGPLDQWRSVAGTKGFEPAFEWLTRLDPSKVTPGRTPIIGDEVYAVASQYATKAEEAMRFEAHRQFLDLQYVVSGQETIGLVPSLDGLTLVEPYDAQKDIAFYALPGSYSRLPMRPGHFVILRPGRPHMPGCHLDGPHDVVKIVVKISATWYDARRA